MIDINHIRTKTIVKIITVAFIYFLSAKAVAPLSLVESGSVFAIWPPTGIALSALFLFGYRIWPGIFLGAFILNLTLSPLLPSFQIALTNTLGPVIGFWLFNKYTKQNIFENTASMVIFFLVITIASIITSLGGCIALLVHELVPKEFLANVWIGWFIGDLIGFLLITPIIESFKVKDQTPKNLSTIESLLIILTIFVTGLVIFGPPVLFDQVEYPVVYFLLPPLIWGALRFGSKVAVISLLIIAIASIYGTILGYGPFLREDPNHSLLLLQSFNGMLAVTILLISSIFKEKELARIELKEHKENLESLVNIRTKELENINLTLEEKVKVEVNKNREKDKQLFLAGKMAAIGDMIGNIAHQWRQPLSVISMESNNILVDMDFERLEEDKTRDRLYNITKQTKYLSETIDTFRNFIKDEKKPKEIVIQESIDKTLNIINATLKNNFIELKKNYQDDEVTKITILENELSQVILNIMNNAKDILIEKKSENRWIDISLKKEDDNILITIEDSGGGIKDDIIDKVFEPYFTTKHQSIGTGLGLHICYRIVVESFKGKLYVKNTKNGAKFFIKIPLK